MNSIICVDISVLISSLNASFQQLFRMLHKTSAKLQKNSELYKRKTQKPAKQRESGLQKRTADNKSRGLLPQSGHCASSLRLCAVLTVPQACGLRLHHVAVVQTDGGDLVFVVAYEVHDGVAFWSTSASMRRNALKVDVLLWYIWRKHFAILSMVSSGNLPLRSMKALTP